MHGKPTVAAGSANGAGVLLPEKTGILLEDRGPQGIAAALRRLVVDPDLRLRMGRAGAEHARTAFDPVLNARKVEAVYRRVAAASSAPDLAAADA
jgi:glycosyltransferase involved in cell wall biosynthesis